MKIFGSLILFLGLVSGGAFYYYQSFVSKPAGVSNEEIVFEVKNGESFNAVTRRLSAMRLISNESLFSLWAKITRQRGRLRAGEYILKQTMTPSQLMNVLASGKSLTHSFTVSEGLNIYEIAILFEKAGFGSKSDFLAACFDQNLLSSLLGETVYSCEGFLFPETYQLERKTSARDLVKIMVQLFLEKWNSIASELERPGWSRYQIVTLASIIEKETGAPEERPLISSVFHNRLNKRMRLQTDPTVLYGILDLTRVYRQNITKKDLETPSKFNTYTSSGLPFGPISNPGLLALRASAQPADSDYLYFVSRNNGTHVFTSTYDDHRRAVKSFQLNSKAREGKSWRDLTVKSKSGN